MQQLQIRNPIPSQRNLKFWEQHDQLLAWFQSTISKEMLIRVIGFKDSWRLFDKIHAYFQHVNTKFV